MPEHVWSLASLILLATCAACGGASSTPPSSPGPKPRLEIQGHRGCRGLRPENTMAGFREAIRLGVDLLELDLALSKDGVLVVVHDPEINDAICTGAKELPSRLYQDLTWDQIRTLDCGSLKNPQFPDQVPVPGQRPPRLEQVLKLLQVHPRLRVNIEIKTFPDRPRVTRPPADFARALVWSLRTSGQTQRVVVQSFDPAALVAVRKLAPRLTLAALADGRKDFDPLLKATGARILSPRYTELRARDVKHYQGIGVRVTPWTVNRQEDMRRLMEWGVDGIITDRPDLLIGLLRQ